MEAFTPTPLHPNDFYTNKMKFTQITVLTFTTPQTVWFVSRSRYIKDHLTVNISILYATGFFGGTILYLKGLEYRYPTLLFLRIVI